MKDEALRLALEALERADKISGHPNNRKTITAIKQALEQPEPEPVAERFEAMHANGDVWITTLAAAQMARTTPPKCEWQGLTDEEKESAMDSLDICGTRLWEGQWNAYADAIETKLKEKNT